ncbi:MAG: TadE/TadG family type IV pilus assembly protein [Candidatus Binataceae bacterium]
MKPRNTTTTKLGMRSGQTLVEFAMVATVFFALLFGIMQMAELVFSYNTICDAAREATRAAIVHGGSSALDSTIQQAAINAAPSLNLTTSNVQVSFPADVNVPSGIDAKVVITYTSPIKLLAFLLPRGQAAPTFKLTATSQMPVSQ